MEKYDSKNRVRGQVSTRLDENQIFLEELFTDCGDIVKQEFLIAGSIKGYLMYVDGLANHQMVEDFVLRPLKNEDLLSDVKVTEQKEKQRAIEKYFSGLSQAEKQEKIQEMLELADVSWKPAMDEAVVEILSGNTLLFIDGIAKGLMISSKYLPTRGVAEVESEKTIRRAKDAFNESMRTSTALLRRRIRDSRLKIKQIFVAQRSRTNVAICYVEGLVREEWLSEIESRLNRYEIDAIYDSAMIEQLLEPSWKSPFPQFQHTERPDKAASALLEGRIVIVVDNSPDVLILPATLNTFFQASDDYYNHFGVATFARILRYIAAVLAIALPGLYIAIVGYHNELLPTELILAISVARESVPFPVVIEILLMELQFELLREAGIRLPGQMDNTIGVVGGLIVGQAAVEAGLVSTIAVIVVAMSALASFAVPSGSFMSAVRMLKFFYIVVCGIWGIYGFLLGSLVLLTHLSSLESLGIPYLMPAVSASHLDYDDTKDFILKKPLFCMQKRPIFTRREEQIRMRKRGIGK